MDEYESTRPIYLQIVEKIKAGIILGEPALGGRLMSIRDMALKMGVNPNTMTRVYAELENEKIVETRRGMGTFVADDPELINRLKGQVIDERLATVVGSLAEAGFSDEQIMSSVRTALERIRRRK
jgi:uncharacterized HTH-type transcriptional regulator yhcF